MIRESHHLQFRATSDMSAKELNIYIRMSVEYKFFFLPILSSYREISVLLCELLRTYSKTFRNVAERVRVIQYAHRKSTQHVYRPSSSHIYPIPPPGDFCRDTKRRAGNVTYRSQCFIFVLFSFIKQQSRTVSVDNIVDRKFNKLCT